MTKRTQLLGATALLVIGIGLVVASYGGNPSLNAAGLAESGFDVGKVLIYGGIFLLIISALLFMSASSE